MKIHCHVKCAINITDNYRIVSRSVYTFFCCFCLAVIFIYFLNKCLWTDTFFFSAWLKQKLRPHSSTSFITLSDGVITVQCSCVLGTNPSSLSLLLLFFSRLRSNTSCTVRWAPRSSCARSVPRTTRTWRLSPVVTSCAPPVSPPGR